MKNIAVLTVSLSLLACNHSHNDDSNPRSFKDIEFDGTWAYSAEYQMYKVSTGEYAASYFDKKTYVFEETDLGVKYYNKCVDYGRAEPSYGFKDNDRFFLWADVEWDDHGFYLKSDNVLESYSETAIPQDSSFFYKVIFTLTKISDTVSIDSGTLTINGPVSLAEYNHVCISELSGTSIETHYNVTVPFGDGHAELFIVAAGQDIIVPGVYDPFMENSDLLVRPEIKMYSSDLTVNGGVKDPNITFIEYSESKMSGTYSVTTDNNDTYTGEFEVYFPWYRPNNGG